MTDIQNSCKVKRSSENTVGMKFSYASLDIKRMHFFQIDIEVRAVDLFSDSILPHRTSMEERLVTNTNRAWFCARMTFFLFTWFFYRVHSSSFISFLYLIHTCYFNNKAWRYTRYLRDVTIKVRIFSLSYVFCNCILSSQD